MTENTADRASVQSFFSSKLWKGLWPRQKKHEPKSASYNSEADDTEDGKRYISEPTNFHINKFSRENYSLKPSSVEDCPFLVTGYGTLLLKDRLKLKKPIKKKLTAFLFEKIILLTSATGMEDEDNKENHRRHSLGNRLWKHLRASMRRNKSSSFVSYCSDEESTTGTSYISQPSNFQRNDLAREHFDFEYDSIQECPFAVTGYGKLLLKDKFKLKKPKKKELTAFLFEKMVVLAVQQKKDDVYYYYASIKISNLSLVPPCQNKKTILLKDYMRSKYSKKDVEYLLEAKTEEMQNTWREIIEKCLWLQLLSAKDQQNG